MKRKKALITVKLVDESIMESNASIAKELMDWFQESTVSIPWVKEVETIVVKDV